MTNVRRLIAVLAAMTALLALALPASAEGICGTLEGRARLSVFATPSDLVAEGVAHTRFDGEYHKVAIDETAFSEDSEFSYTVQEWYFDGGLGMLEFSETATLTPLGGPMVAFESTFEVTAGGSGGGTYSGVFNTRSLTAHYEVAGEVCFGS